MSILKGAKIVYKSRIILSSLTTLGLVGAGYVATNHMNLVSAESGSNAKVETIASKIETPKKVETTKPTTVHAEEVKPLSVNTELVENAVVETESIENAETAQAEESNLVAEEVSNTTAQVVVESNQEAPATENVTSNQETTSNEVVTPVDEGIKDEVIYDSRTEVESTSTEESNVNEIINIQDVPEVENVSRETVTEETQPEAEAPASEETVSDTPAETTETKVEEEVQPTAEETKAEETPKVEEVKEKAPKTEVKSEETASPVETPAPKVEETKVETPKVEVPAAPKALTNPINDKTNTYPIGQCTWGVKSLADWVGNYWGNANQWGDSARKAGYTTGSTPQVGSVVVFPNVIYEGINYGHVAYVTHVYDDGSIEVMEANYGGNQSIGNYRCKFNPNDARHGGGG